MSKASREWKQQMRLFGVPKSRLTLRRYRKMRRDRGRVIRATARGGYNRILGSIKAVDPVLIEAIAKRLATMQAVIKALTTREAGNGNNRADDQ